MIKLFPPKKTIPRAAILNKQCLTLQFNLCRNQSIDLNCMVSICGKLVGNSGTVGRKGLNRLTHLFPMHPFSIL